MSLNVMLFSLVAAAALVLYSVLLCLTWRRGLDRAVARWFAVYLASMAVWSLGALMMYLDRANAAAWNKVMLCGTALMPLAFYGFVQGFLATGRHTWWAQLGGMLVFILLTLTILGDVAGDIYVTDSGLIEFSLGAATPLFGLYYFLFIGLATYDLAREIIGAKDFAARNRAKYVSLGLGAIVLGSLTNTSTILRSYPLDIASNTISAFLIAYAISRYHLLDIALVMRKGLLYFLPTVVIAAGYLLIILLGVNFLHFTGASEVFFSIIVAVIVAVALQPVRERAQDWVDRHFFREKYNASEMLQRLSRTVASVLDVQQLAGMVLDEIATTMHVTTASLLLKDTKSGNYLPIAGRGLGGQTELRLLADNPIAHWLTRHTTCLTQHTVAVEPQFAGLWGEERAGLQQAQIELFVPLLIAEDLLGILALGPKRSEVPYGLDDQLTLMTLANQTAVAVQNARLYHAAVEEKERTETILQQAFSGIMAINPALQINAMNRGAETITGHTAQEILGRRLPDIFGPELWGEESALYLAITTGQPQPPSEIMIHGKHEARDILMGVTPLREGYLLNFTDITRLKEVDRLKSNIVANVSHELRTPLASIKAYTELLLDEFEGEDKALRLRFLTVIDAEADRLAEFINDLLDLSRLQSGRVEQRVGLLAVDRIVDDVVKSLEIQAQRAGVNIWLDIADALPLIFANADLIRSMARNLIGNAIKYSPKGGQVHIEICRVGKNIVLDVIDQGIGISPEDLAHLFTRFYRSWTARQSGIRGTGLGLVLAKEAVEFHHGTIGVESQVGVGTRFTVTLPLPNSERPAELSPETAVFQGAEA